MTFSKYKPFVVDVNKRYLLGLMECFKELSIFEMEKMKGTAQKQGKKGGKAPAARQSVESTAFINTCLEVLKVLDRCNDVDLIGDHRFQILVRPRLTEAMDYVFDDARVSPSIWKSRINQMEKAKKKVGANPFLTMLVNISVTAREQVHTMFKLNF